MLWLFRRLLSRLGASASAPAPAIPNHPTVYWEYPARALSWAAPARALRWDPLE